MFLLDQRERERERERGHRTETEKEYTAEACNSKQS